MPQNLIDDALQQPQDTGLSAPTSSPSGNLIDSSLTSNPVSYSPQPKSSGNLIDSVLQTDSDAPKLPTPPNTDEPWYSKAWSWANTPLTESLGIPSEREGAGGFERAGEHILAGFTSPLSLLLTAATFGTGGFIESAGANVLKEAGMSAAEIAEVAKGSEAALQATKALEPSETGVLDAVKSAGVDPDVWKRGQDLLYKNGLNENDLLGGSLLERGAYQVVRKAVPEMPVAAAARAAKTGQALMNAGFTYQQFQTAAQMSPRFLDALKDGDYDKAAEYGTEALAGGVLGTFGASHALSSAGELFSPVLDPASRLRPTDETMAVNRVLGERDAKIESAIAQARNIDKNLRETLGHEDPLKNAPFELKPEVKAKQAIEAATVMHQIVTGGDMGKAAAWHDALAEADGRDERLSPGNGQIDPVLQDKIDNNNFSKLDPKYKDLILKSLKRVATGDLSEKELAASKQMRTELDKNFEMGSQSDLLHDYVEDYMQRMYKDENPEGKIVLDQTRSGKFSTNVNMAKQRVYDSHLTALLKSPKEMVLDPIALAAEGRRVTLEAAANKKMMSDILDRGTRGSDGRPVAVLSGTGRTVEGTDGENPATMIDPKRIRNINIADTMVDQLTKTGDLQRYIDDGTIKDITSKVNPSNLDLAISKLEQEGVTARGGTGENMPMDQEGNSILRKNIQLLKDVRDGKRLPSDLKEYNDTLKPKYAWDPQDYISVNNGALRGWNFITKDTSGNNILVKSDIRLHPEFADYLKNRLGLEKSSLQQNPVSKALLGVGGAIKKNILSLSPFHLAQEALRGIMVGINPLHLDGPDIETGARINPADPNSPTKISEMVKQGFTPGVDYNGLEAHSEGVQGGAGLLRKVPGIGKTVANSLDWYQNFLFKRYIPGLKSRAAELMFDRYQTAHPDWSVERVAKAAGRHSNETFGGVNWKAMGRSATTQDWGRLMALAPDWLEAEMRSGARLFNKEEGGLGREQMLKMTMGLWGISRALNVLSTGNMHNEAPFGVAVKNKDGKEIVYSIRVLPTDLLHLASDPANFVRGRLSPTAHIATEAITSRDNFGRKLTPQDMAVDVFRSMAPIPLEALGQAVSGTGPDVGNTGQIVKALGGTATTYSTPAQKLAAELAANHNEDGPLDISSMARHRTIMDMESKVRAGEMPMTDIYRMYAAGQLHADDLKKISTNVAKTKDMDSSMASLYSRVSRLPAPEFLKVYDQMSPHEKAALLPLTLQVRKRYISKAMKNEQPSERLSDPVFVRLMNMVSEQSPF